MAYSPTVRDHFFNPRNAGTLEQPDAIGTMGAAGKGNFMLIQLKLSGDRVLEARFQTYGCPGAIASGSMLTDLVRGRTIEEAQRISEAELLENLGGLPPGKTHCAGLAVGALRNAIGKLRQQPHGGVT